MLSVVMPARDAADTIGRALASVVADEIVVVDDGSVDGTGALARAAGAVVLRREGIGTSAARSVAIDAARGDVIVCLDADDELIDAATDPRPGLLATADVAIGHTEVVDADGNVAERSGLIWGTPGLAFRREAFLAIGPFDPAHPVGGDIDWILRARDAGLRIAQTDTVVYRYRRRAGSLSDGRGQTALLQALRGTIERSRT